MSKSCSFTFDGRWFIADLPRKTQPDTAANGFSALHLARKKADSQSYSESMRLLHSGAVNRKDPMNVVPKDEEKP